MTDTFQLLGNIGEFFGAIAVVITLLYLAAQVKQNSRLIEHQTLLGSTDQMSKFMALMAGSSEVADLFVKGRRSRSDLTEAEQAQFDNAIALHLSAIEYHVRKSEDVTRDQDAPAWMEIVKYFIDNPGGSEFWAAHHDKFYPEFEHWVGSELHLRDSTDDRPTTANPEEAETA